METPFPIGTWIRVRNANFLSGYEYGKITFDGWELALPPIGAIVHKIVWKGETVESHGTFIFKGEK